MKVPPPMCSKIVTLSLVNHGDAKYSAWLVKPWPYLQAWGEALFRPRNDEIILAKEKRMKIVTDDTTSKVIAFRSINK